MEEYALSVLHQNNINANYHTNKDETRADMVPEVLEGEKRCRNGGKCTSGLAPKWRLRHKYKKEINAEITETIFMQVST